MQKKGIQLISKHNGSARFKDGSMWDVVPVKISLSLRYWHETKAFAISCYELGRLQASPDAAPVRIVPDVLRKTKEIVNYVIGVVSVGGRLSSGQPSGTATNLVIEFWKPAGGRKKPLVAYKLFMGGSVSLESEPLILPFPGMDRPGEMIIRSDDLLRPLVISILGFCNYAIEKQKTIMLQSASGAGDVGSIGAGEE
jgi:hypothetical protein